MKLKIKAFSNKEEKFDLTRIHDLHLKNAKQAKKCLKDGLQKVK